LFHLKGFELIQFSFLSEEANPGHKKGKRQQDTCRKKIQALNALNHALFF
jgi:hypothetical protein